MAPCPVASSLRHFVPSTRHSPLVISFSELVAQSDANLPRRLVGEDAAEVSIRRAEAGLCPVVVLEHTLSIEQVEDVGQQDQALAAEADSIVGVHVDLRFNRRSLAETILGLE